MQGFTDPTERMRWAREEYESRINVGSTLGQPYRDTAKSATEAAVKFAENSFKSVTLLNGGGLVAITPVMTLVGASTATDGRTILGIACGYCVGLLAALGGQVSGFLAMSRRAEAADQFHLGVNSFLAIETAPTEEARNQHRVDQATREVVGMQKLVLYNRWRAIGLSALGIASLAFIIASACGAFWFWNKLSPTALAAGLNGSPFPLHWLERGGAISRGVP